MALQHIRSSTLDKRPLAASLSDGQLAINTNLNAPGVFFKNSDGALVKVGPTFVGTTAPNSTPASGGATGNTLGEQWLDTSGGTYVLKIWDGTAWRSEAGEFVNVTGDTMTGALVMDNQQQVRFRETTANGTNYIALQAPASVASDKTITLPDVTGTVVTTGDTGSVTSTMIADGTILNADVNASAAIAGTKISPDFGSQNVTTTGTVTGASLNPTSSTVPTNGVYLPAANSVGISTNSSERIRIGANGEIGIAGANYGTSGQVLTSAGSGAAPTWQTPTATTDKIEEGNTSAEVIDTGSDGRFVVTTEGSERLRVTSAGLVGIGTTNPSTMLQIGNSATAGLSVAMGGVGFQTIFRNSADEDNYITQGATGSTRFRNHNGTEYGRWDSSGRLLVGTSTNAPSDTLFVVHGQPGNANEPAVAQLRRGGTILADYTLGQVSFADGSGNVAAHIRGVAETGWGGSGDAPGRLTFSTTADGASSPTERMRITQAGFITNKGSSIYVDDLPGAGFTLAPTRATFTTNSGNVVRINRDGNDGDLITFHQDSGQEGSISVSGSTVSYNGAHLSRWSQLPGGVERTEIMRGTVLSNIDEMCEWGDEDNEQLNRMKVSDVEGDKNVSGVFQAWDDDDDTYTNDFYCAMTGDFIIRIGAGVTVERGALLMSAGDGTAKPQEDDIIRSKTIAKVTSTNVSCTYPDGSYCVPCVLMAC